MVGRILAEIDISTLLHVRSQATLALILINAGIAPAFCLIGYFAVKYLLQPLRVLSGYVERVREGRVEPIPDRYRKNVASEFGHLFDRFNAMARAVSDRATFSPPTSPSREKYAMLGRSPGHGA